MPSLETIRVWLKNKPELSAQYAQAHEAYAESVFEEMLEIADDSRNDFMEREKNGRSFVVLDDEAVSRSRLRIDTRKWMLARMAPKKYGDKIEVDNKHSGTIGLANILTEIDTAGLPRNDS